MTMDFETEQESFWAGSFGNDYISRNESDALLASKTAFFARALRRAGRIGSCMEFGSNIGLNLRALKILYPNIDLHAIEINKEAADRVAEIVPKNQVHNISLLDFNFDRTYELIFSMVVLIHINPEKLEQLYDVMVKSTSRYLLIAEYYNPSPVEVSYRGHERRLFKRDFCGEILDRHSQLRLVDYGFVYHRDAAFPLDDITWFLMEKR